MGEYDHAMKSLVDADPLAFARFALSQNERTRYLTEADQHLRLVGQLNTEFPGTEARADGLLMLEHGSGEPFMVHIEFQSSKDTNMGERMLDYGVRARGKHGPLPIAACVIYLRDDGRVQEPPHRWPFFEGPPNLAFDYTCIKLWEMERCELLDLQQPALLPLTLLTKGGANRILVKDTLEELLRHKRYDLLPIGQTIASWLLKGIDLDWLKKEYLKMLDLFKDSPAYQWISAEALERGRAEERSNTLEILHQMVTTLVAERFPELAGRADKKVPLIKDLERLQQLNLRIGLSKDIAEAAGVLAELPADAAE